MKTLFTIAFALLLALSSFAVSPTPYTFQFYNADGTPMTNYITLQGWPASANQVIVVSNSLVFSIGGVTNTPMANGCGTNTIMAGSYRVFVPALNVGFLVNIPVTTTTNPLTTYVVGSPVVYQASGFYGFITNSLGYVPAPLNPATNTMVYMTNFVFTTNSSGCVTNIVPVFGSNTLNYQHQ